MDDTAGRIETAGSRAADAGNAGTTQTSRSRNAGAEDRDETDERALEIRHEIEATRDEMTETIDAIQEKLKPRNILANATDRVKSATAEGVSEMADTAGRTARQAIDYSRQAATSVAGTAGQNVLPLALIGVGAAWLLTNRSRSASSSYGGRHGTRRGERETRDYLDEPDHYAVTSESWYEEDEDWDSGVIARLRNNPIPAAMAAVGFGWLAFSGSDRGDYERQDSESWRQGQGASESVGELASRAREDASETANSVGRAARRRTNQMQRMVHDSPLLVGAGALLLGAAFGLAVPETEAENEWMGEARDTMVDRARTAAKDAASEVQEAASTVVEVAKKVTGKTET
jgi:hypothetical protein